MMRCHGLRVEELGLVEGEATVEVVAGLAAVGVDAGGVAGVVLATVATGMLLWLLAVEAELDLLLFLLLPASG